MHICILFTFGCKSGLIWKHFKFPAALAGLYLLSILYKTKLVQCQNIMGNGVGRRRRPKTTSTFENIARVEQILKKDRRVSCRMIVESMGIPKTPVQGVLQENLKKRKLCSHTVTTEQWQQWVSHVEDQLKMIENEIDFVDSMITGEESRCSIYNP